MVSDPKSERWSSTAIRASAVQQTETRVATTPLATTLSPFLESEQFQNPEISVFASGLNEPFGLVFDDEGNLLCTYRDSSQQDEQDKGRYKAEVMKIRPSGKREALGLASSEIPDKAVFTDPGGVDILGNWLITSSYSTGMLYRLMINMGNITEVVRVTPERTQQVVRVVKKGENYAAVPAIVYAMALDHKNRTVYLSHYYHDIAYITPSFRPFRSLIIWKWYLRVEGDVAVDISDVGIWLEETAIHLSRDASVTSMTIRDDDLFIAVQGKGIVKVKISYKGVSEWTTGDTFKDVEILGMIFDRDNNLYASANHEGSNGQIYKISHDGKASGICAEGFTRPAGLVIKENYLYVADFGDGKIYKVRIARQGGRPADQQKATGLNQPSAKPLTNQDVIDLAKGDSDESNLIQRIKEAKAVQFDLSVKALRKLRKSGISHKLIAAMRARQAATRGQAPPHEVKGKP